MLRILTTVGPVEEKLSSIKQKVFIKKRYEIYIPRICIVVHPQGLVLTGHQNAYRREKFQEGGYGYINSTGHLVEHFRPQITWSLKLICKYGS